MRWSPFLSITRPVNSFMAGLAGVLGYLIATGTITLPSLILLPVVALITAAGNVLNDYYDAEIDAVNRPDRPIPAGKVSREAARNFAIVLFVAGNVLCLLTNYLCLAIVVFNSILLAVYARYLKRTPAGGNVAVAYLTGSIFLFGGAFIGVSGLVRNFSVFAITLLATMTRELLKAAEDVEGDRRGGARTLPAWIGVPSTVRIALFFAIVAVVVSLLPTDTWTGLGYYGGIVLVDGAILFSAVLPFHCTTGACVRRTKATSYLKGAMFAALAVFTVAAIL